MDTPYRMGSGHLTIFDHLLLVGEAMIAMALAISMTTMTNGMPPMMVAMAATIVTTPLEVLQEVETKSQGMVFIAAPSDAGLILFNLLTLTYYSTRPDDVD